MESRNQHTCLILVTELKWRLIFWILFQVAHFTENRYVRRFLHIFFKGNGLPINENRNARIAKRIEGWCNHFDGNLICRINSVTKAASFWFDESCRSQSLAAFCTWKGSALIRLKCGALLNQFSDRLLMFRSFRERRACRLRQTQRLPSKQ